MPSTKYKNPWKTNSETEIYDNPWIQVRHCEVTTPAGTEGIYGVVHFKNIAIGIVPLDEDLNTWIVGQYRYTLNDYSWEIPEGGGIIGVPALDSAKRELKEETGILAQKWTPILELHTSNSVTDEYGVAYVAQDLEFGESEPEDTEELIIRKLPFQEVLDMVIKDEITDALSMTAVMKTNIMLERGLL